MTRHLTALFFTFTVAFGARGSDIDECLRTLIDVKAVRALVKATSAASLNEARSRIVVRNSVTAAVYALRRYELEKTRANAAALIATIPRSDFELLSLYSLSYPDVALRERPEIFADYIAAVFEVSRKERRNYPAFLRLGVLAQGGELGETISSYIEHLYDADEAGVELTLANMQESERKLVCGEESIPCPRARMGKER
jgi:hypothetical protein